MNNHKTNYVLKGDQLEYNINGHAFHIDAYKTSEYFRELSVQNGVKHIEGTVRDFDFHSVTLKDGREITYSQTVLDSQEFFHKTVVGKIIQSISLSIVVSHSEPLMRRRMSTQLQKAWIMGGHGRYQCEKVGRGYVYCDEFETDVEQEIEKRYGQVEWGKEISFKSGRLEKFINRNCVSIGLSSTCSRTTSYN